MVQILKRKEIVLILISAGAERLFTEFMSVLLIDCLNWMHFSTMSANHGVTITGYHWFGDVFSLRCCCLSADSRHAVKTQNTDPRQVTHLCFEASLRSLERRKRQQLSTWFDVVPEQLVARQHRSISCPHLTSLLFLSSFSTQLLLVKFNNREKFGMPQSVWSKTIPWIIVPSSGGSCCWSSYFNTTCVDIHFKSRHLMILFCFFYVENV